MYVIYYICTATFYPLHGMNPKMKELKISYDKLEMSGGGTAEYKSINPSHGPIAQGKVQSEENSHTQGKITDSEKPIQEIIRVGIGGFQGVSPKFKKAHGD